MYNNVLTARVTVVTQKGIGRCIIVVGELLYNTLLVPVLTRFFRGWVVGVGGLEPMTSKFMFYIKKNIQKYRGMLVHVILYKDSPKYALKTGKTLKKKNTSYEGLRGMHIYTIMYIE